MTPEQIIADATEALAIIDDQITDLRAERKRDAERIAVLLEERKPMARIVRAATPRRQNVDHGESE